MSNNEFDKVIGSIRLDQDDTDTIQNGDRVDKTNIIHNSVQNILARYDTSDIDSDNVQLSYSIDIQDDTAIVQLGYTNIEN